MSDDKKIGKHGGVNVFGGKNRRGLYVPMSEDEQEVIHRLVEAEDIQLIIHGWGTLDRPRFLVGDHRIGVQFKLTFNRPAAPMPLYFLDLELITRTGISLVKERLPTILNGQPVNVCAGVFLDLQWDIAMHSMDPRLVKLLKPGTLGLTSRRQDKDTGEMTARGNMKLDAKQRKALQELETAQAANRAEDVRRIVKVTKDAGYEVKKTDKGFEAPDLD
jgi:hypothetical protein